jgi:rhomboid protease GluP
MSRVEPSWETAGTTRLDERANAFGIGKNPDEPVNAHFDIRLGGNVKKMRGEYRARSFRRKGSIRFDEAGRVTIQVSAFRLFGKDVETEYLLGPHDVYNVQAKGRLVRLEIVTAQGGLHLLILRTRNRSEAADIASLLPGQMTATFSAETAAMSRFLEGLERLTPHVWGTWTIVALNTLVFLAMAASGAGFFKSKPAVAIAYGSNFGPDTLNGEWWRLFTSTFIHFGFAHIAFNMLVLAQTGRIVERLYGNARFITLYLFAGLTGSLLSVLWHPEVNSAGASGAIFGVLGAMLAYVLRYRSAIPPSIYASRFQMAISFIAYNLFYGFTHHGIDNGAHLGGLAGGFLMGWVLARPIDPDLPRQAIWTTTAEASMVALIAFTALAWPLVHLNRSEDAHEELHFFDVEQREVPAEQKAVADLKAISHMPNSPAGRADIAQRIRTVLVPEWDQLYQSLDAAPLPPNSKQEPVREAALRYYDDIRKALLVLEDMADHDDLNQAHSVAEVKSLFDDAKRQRETIRKLAAHS